MPSFGLFRKQKEQDNKTTSTIAPSSSSSSLSKREDEVVAVGQVAKNVQETKAEQISAEALAALAVEEKAEGASVGKESSPSELLGKEDKEVVDQKVFGEKLYLKAMPLRDTLDLEGIKAEVEEGNILILRITPLASKSIEAVKSAVNELYIFAESIGGDIARLGEERVVICPKNVKIWREKSAFKNSEPSASSLSSTVA
jgi:SepF-like predicted cell division protein (DUF552 family)